MEGKSLDYVQGWKDCLAVTNPPFILDLKEVNDLLNRSEKAFMDGPANKKAHFQISAETLHELLMLWKLVRFAGLAQG